MLVPCAVVPPPPSGGAQPLIPTTRTADRAATNVLGMKCLGAINVRGLEIEDSSPTYAMESLAKRHRLSADTTHIE